MKTKLFYLHVILAGFFLAACDVVQLEQLNATDSEDGSLTEDELQGPSTVPSTAEEVLSLLHNGTEKAWEAEGFTIFGMSGFLSCRLDDNMILAADGTYRYDGGVVLCGAEDNTRFKEGTWELSDDLQTITFVEGSETFRADLMGLTTDQITLRGNYQGLEVNGVYTSN